MNNIGYPTNTIFSPPPTNNINTMNPTQGEPKRKRVQVSAACQQCKRAHAACSNTRPCDRCVRINQAAACIAGSSHASAPAPAPAPAPASPAMRPMAKPHTLNDVGMNVGTPVLNTNVYDVDMNIPAVASPNLPFNDQDLSRFLFEETQNDFSLNELPAHFEYLEASTGSESDCSTMSTPSPCSAPSTPSPCNSAVPSPATTSTPPSPPCTQNHYQHQQQQQQQQTQQPQQLQQPTPMPSPLFVQASVEVQLPPRMVGPSANAIAASIASAYAQTAQGQAQAQAHGAQTQGVHVSTDGTHVLLPQQDMFMRPQQQEQTTPVPPSATPTTAPLLNLTSATPQNNLMEMMVSELMQQNKKMESMMMSMTTEMKSLRQEVTHLRNNEPTSSALMTTKNDRVNGPATAVWTVSDGLLIEHNQKFAQILDLMEVPKGYSMQHFFGGPCSKAASARMNHHLENIQNAQPVTDYAVIERKRVTGEVMRLMIVVNVVPTSVPVFITTMYEL